MGVWIGALMKLFSIFLFLFIFSLFLVEVFTPVCVYYVYSGELRESRMQILRSYYLRKGDCYSCIDPSSADLLISYLPYYLWAMESLNISIDYDYYLRFLASLQYINWSDPFFNGGWPWGYWLNGVIVCFDLAQSFYVVNILHYYNRLDLIDVDALKHFVLVRYNWSSGGFHEIRYNATNRPVALSNVPVFFHYFKWDMFAYDNIFSTYFAVSILDILNGLNMINKTLTAEFILSLLNPVGLFYPVRNYSIYHPLHPAFPLDGYGTYSTYVYSAYMTLKKLGKLDILPDWVMGNIVNYVKELFMVVNATKYYFHDGIKDAINMTIGYFTDTAISNSYYSPIIDIEPVVNWYMVDLLDNMGLLNDFFSENKRVLIANTLKYLQRDYYHGYPVEKPADSKYGALDVWFVIIMNLLNLYDLFDEPTPRVIKTLENLKSYSRSIIYKLRLLLVVVYVATYLIVKKLLRRKRYKGSLRKRSRENLVIICNTFANNY